MKPLWIFLLIVFIFALFLMLYFFNKNSSKTPAREVIRANQELLNRLADKKTPPPLMAEALAQHYVQTYLPSAIIPYVPVPLKGEKPTDSRPGKWVPTPPEYSEPLLPEFGRKPTYTDPITPSAAPPHAWDSPQVMKMIFDAERIGGTKNTTRTQAQTESALKWNLPAGTVTPPGIWNVIAQSSLRGETDQVAIKVLTLLNMALYDAAVAAWNCKYLWNTWRPVTAIRQAGNSDWTSLITTPPFPSCISGHSTFSGAAERILTALLGARKVDVHHDGYHYSFPSYTSASEDAGMSRIFGGIHIDMDNELGLKIGREIADAIISKYG
jgi:PAP2 superfamily